MKGDAVLLEWAVEALTKNAIDALAGRAAMSAWLRTWFRWAASECG